LLTSKVATWFSTSYEYDQRDFDGIKKYGNAYHPTLGYYKSGDRKILETQLQWMRRAGIDFFLLDCTSSLFRGPTDAIGDRTLKAVADLLDKQESQSRKLEFCIFVEKYLMTPNAQELDAVLEYVQKELAGHRYYTKLHGKPLVILYVNDEVNEMVKAAREKFKKLEIRVVSGEFFDASYWRYVEKYPQTLSTEWIPVSPGFDSSLEMLYVRDAYLATKEPELKQYLQHILSRWNLEDMEVTAETVRKNAFFKEERLDGSTYRQQLLRAVEKNPEIIYISGWNDWQFGNQIEPGVEYGFQYVDTTADLLGRAGDVKEYRKA
jgi:hypothetical protein